MCYEYHKNLDDVFNKDFVHGKFNVEHKQKYDGAEMCNGSVTYKLSHNPIVGSTSASAEAKSTIDKNFFGLKFLNGIRFSFLNPLNSSVSAMV